MRKEVVGLAEIAGEGIARDWTMLFPFLTRASQPTTRAIRLASTPVSSAPVALASARILR
jgi:hypothetical protein